MWSDSPRAGHTYIKEDTLRGEHRDWVEMWANTGDKLYHSACYGTNAWVDGVEGFEMTKRNVQWACMGVVWCGVVWCEIHSNMRGGVKVPHVSVPVEV